MLECSSQLPSGCEVGNQTLDNQAARLPVCSWQGLLHPASYKVVVAGGPLKFHSNPATTTPSAGLETAQ